MNKILYLLTFCYLSLPSYAQNDPTILTVNGQPITVSEFKYIYEKSNGKSANYSKQSLEESLQLYTKFKLKVAKAREMKLDTLNSLVIELNSYKKQLANSYLTDKEISEKLAKVYSERLKTDIRLSHIFISSSNPNSPNDTLTGYERMKKVESELKKGKTFEECVVLYSEDPGTNANKGDLGFLTSLFPNGYYYLENAGYSLKKGEVSGAVRSISGWHFLKLTDSRPALGDIELAQILVRISKDKDPAFSQNKIDSIYQTLQNGADFLEAAKQFSEDLNTSKKGGYLGFIRINQFSQEFEKQAFALKNDGEISKPFLTSLGIHIIKRISKPEQLTFEEGKKYYINKISQNERFTYAKSALEEKIKKENNFKINQKAYKIYQDSINNDAIFSLKWEMPKIPSQTLFSFTNKLYSTNDFSNYIKENIKMRSQLPKNSLPSTVLEKMFSNFITAKTLEYEEGNLDKKYPEFKALTREYEEGFLFFEVTNKEVWNKASQDSIGLQRFYDINKANYRWEERAKIAIINVSSDSKNNLDAKVKEIVDTDNLKLQEKYSGTKDANIEYQEETYEKSSYPASSKLTWGEGKTAVELDEKNPNNAIVYKIMTLIPPGQKELKESKGFVIADYQDYLDKIWVDQLKKEYKVKVNQEVLDKLIKK